MDIKRDDYQRWRHDPVSKFFLKFLLDKQAELKSIALESWVNGSQSFSDCNQTIRGQIIELKEIAELPFEAIEEFYKDTEENNAAENSIGTSR